MAPDDVELRRIEKGQLDELVDAQNAIFSDYVAPMRSSRTFFLDFLQSVGGRMDNVIVAMENGKIVGYVNPVVDGKEAWIGGVGVIPSHRSRGIGSRLMLEAEKLARRRGAETSTLEVIEANVRAHDLYKNLGYVDRRTYVCAEGKPAQYVGYGPQPRAATVEHLVEMHRHAYADTCWQRRKRSGLMTSGRSAESYAVEGGFVMIRKVDTVGYVPFLGVMPERRREGIGTSLAKFALNRLHELGTFKVAIYNLNEDPAVLRMLDKFDFAVTMKQVEMHKPLRE